jgi:hypothetical protein
MRDEITKSAQAIFDVSAFRPNVVLELGYALAIKDKKKYSLRLINVNPGPEIPRLAVD